MICHHHHEHEKSSTCFEVHGCRCQWCVSENTARFEEAHPERPKKWEGAEFLEEVEFLVSNGLNGREAAKALGREVNSAKAYLTNKSRQDLANYL